MRGLSRRVPPPRSVGRRASQERRRWWSGAWPRRRCLSPCAHLKASQSCGARQKGPRLPTRRLAPAAGVVPLAVCGAAARSSALDDLADNSRRMPLMPLRDEGTLHSTLARRSRRNGGSDIRGGRSGRRRISSGAEAEGWPQTPRCVGAAARSAAIGGGDETDVLAACCRCSVQVMTREALTACASFLRPLGATRASCGGAPECSERDACARRMPHRAGQGAPDRPSRSSFDARRLRSVPPLTWESGREELMRGNGGEGRREAGGGGGAGECRVGKVLPRPAADRRAGSGERCGAAVMRGSRMQRRASASRMLQQQR
jgi:hypothetical protein